MKQRTKLLIISSLLSGCASIERPDTNLCIVNYDALHLKCYNMKNDYTNSGSLKPEAIPTLKEITSLQDLNKNLCIDPDGTANLKAYLRKLAEKQRERE